MPTNPIKVSIVLPYLAMLLVGGLLPTANAWAQSELDAKPIFYLSSQAKDPVARWINQLEKAKADESSASLSWDSELGWLPAVLDGLKVPAESQTLVFSKTSLQIRSISPENPRAIFFNDDVYVGFVPGGKLIELSAVDPKLGAVFYTVEQNAGKLPQVKRENHQCLSCHSSAKTKGVPGYLVRSVYPAASGHPVYAFGTTTTDHTTALQERFGGWYISNSSKHQHRANRFVVDGDNRRSNQSNVTPDLQLFATDSDNPETGDRNADRFSANPRVRLNRYPHDRSEMVALMVLEHQTQGHNVMTAASWDVRQALDYQQVMNEALGRAAEFQSESTKRRISRSIDNIVNYFLFVDEAALDIPLSLDNEFCSKFIHAGPRDSRNRSLRDFEGRTRMFRYPCSFLIYTEAFEQLPAPVRNGVLKKIRSILTTEILTTENVSEQHRGDVNAVNDFAHLDQETRKALDEILSETVPGYSGDPD